MDGNSWNAKFKVSGTEFIPGMRNGNLAKASFNTPKSIVIYNRNLT